MPNDAALRQHLIELLDDGHAHIAFDEVVNDFPLEHIGDRLPGAPHSAWELLEHMRIAQEDIVRFSQSADWVSPPWPKGYWPASPKPAGDARWRECAQAIRDNLAEFKAMIQDPAQDLFRKFPWGEGQTLLREALLIADHNAYHLGQLVLLRRLLGAWE